MRFSRPGAVSICAFVVVAAPRIALAQLTTRERADVFNEHNAARCTVSPPAQTMPALAWDDALAQVAQNWANTVAGSATTLAQRPWEPGSGTNAACSSTTTPPPVPPTANPGTNQIVVPGAREMTLN